MKNLIPAAILISFILSGAELSISPATVRPDGVVLAEIRYVAQESQITALQFDLQYDASNLNVSAAGGAAATAAGKLLSSQDVSPGVKRFLLIGFNQSALPDGAIASLLLSFTSPGSYALHLSNAIATDKDGGVIALSTADGNVSVQADSTVRTVGAFGQIASGGGWKTSLTIVNLSSAPTTASLKFWGNDGQPLAVPLAFPNSDGQRSTATSFDCPLGPGATAAVETEAPDAAQILTGWVELQTSDDVIGFAVLRSQITKERTAEAMLSFDVGKAAAFIVPYDNTVGFETGLAIMNYSADSAAELVLRLCDEAGNTISTESLPLVPRGHISFAASERFPAASERRGTIEVRNSSGNPISVVGLRFSRSGSFTSIPVIPR